MTDVLLTVALPPTWRTLRRCVRRSPRLHMGGLPLPHSSALCSLPRHPSACFATTSARTKVFPRPAQSLPCDRDTGLEAIGCFVVPSMGPAGTHRTPEGTLSQSAPDLCLESV
ncbi:hypothetical protein C8J57DRAFT_1521819 [Mycena rebaudengoi]|nr:hypothetical protein C8J57DRAFT_1521819 [Mycena rebaudengoi]